MATKARLKTYAVSFAVEAKLDLNITAASPEEAIAKARELEDNDVLSQYDEIIDAEVELTGVYQFEP